MFPRLWSWARIVLLLAVLAEASPSAGAGYSIHMWQTEDGLPQNGVTSILQSAEGYLWIGTYGGLVRFDGARFTVFDGGNTPELQNSRVTSLFEDARGALWIGHETGDLTRFQAGRFQPWRIPGATNREKIIAIGADASGKVWLLDQAGLAKRVEDGRVLAPESRPDQGVGTVALTQQPSGALWVARGGIVSTLQDGRWEVLTLDRTPFGGFATGIGASRDGGLWVIADGRVRKWRAGHWADDWGISPWGNSSVTAVLEMRNGYLAVGTIDHGLYLLPGKGEALHYDRASGLPQDWVRSLCEDREGNLWVGAGSRGLVALRPARVTVLNAPDHWQGRNVLSVTATRDGALWVGTEGAGLYRHQSGEWTRFAEQEGVPNLFVWSLAEGKAGQLWVGTWGGGLLERHGEHFERVADLAEVSTPMPALYAAKDGVLWAGTGAGLLRHGVGAPVWYGERQGLVAPDVRAVTQDREGTVWFGMFGGGLGQLKDGRLRQFRKSDGLSSDFVQCLLPGRDGTLWIGTSDGGLNRLKDGKFSVIGMRQGLPNNVICHLAEDHRGFFWIGSHGGILRVATTELERCAAGEINAISGLVYGRGDGLPTLECAGGLQPAGAQTADGRLWFSTSKGLVAVDPENVFTNQLAPPVVIEELRVDDQVLESHGPAGAALQIPPGRQRFEIRYTGLSFAAPERVFFKHRLEGLERQWTDAGTRRTAAYSYLPPGDYVFRVIACNNDGVWNLVGATRAFTVLPHFWQTWWFRGLAGGGVVALAGLGMLWTARRKLRRHIERVERQQAIERERARIAQDIHDDLGASLTRISLLSQTARSELDNPARAAANLDRIYGTARELTRAMDEIVWAVNPRHDTLDSLASYLGRFAQDFLGTAGLRCRLDVPVQLPAWPLTAEIRHNLFLAFKEALNNVLKHAAARQVSVSLVLYPAAFAVTVEDDGAGFAPGEFQAAAAVETRGNGITNMRRRLADIGGRCEIDSQPGKGTRLRFHVPVAAVRD